VSAHAPLRGRILTPGFVALLAVGGVGAGLMLYRFFAGLGPVTGLNDGYPWGLWIAFDVVTGTALACGGYAVALLVFVFNKGTYHPLVRPALLTSALGYTVAGASVFLDIGRWWNAWKLPIFFWKWNGGSALLEVALCIMAYVVVAWIEVSHSMLEKWEREARFPILTRVARVAAAPLTKALPFVIALGILLPTMHQSSLGTLMVVAGTKVHPLWHTPLLPALFLVSCLGMGYAGVVLEATVSGAAFGVATEWKLLGKLSRFVGWAGLAWAALRIADLALRGALAFAFDKYTALFFLEIVLLTAPAALLWSADQRGNRGFLFAAALCAVFGGALYRFDTYLVAFDPGPNWSYFPSVAETLITLGLISLEIAAYVLVVKLFPIFRAQRPAKAA